MAGEPKLSRAWRLEHQWWFLLILFPFAWLGWAAFGYLGFRLHNRPWIAVAVGYFAAMLVGTILLVGDGWMNVTGFLILLSVWIWTFAHGLIIRREALDRLSLDEDPRLREARSRMVTREAAEEMVKEKPGLAREAGIGQSADSFGGLIDINHAPADQIALLPGFGPELAQRVVEVREDIDGFDSVNDFAHVLDLPPRLIDQIRDRLVCFPR